MPLPFHNSKETQRRKKQVGKVGTRALVRTDVPRRALHVGLPRLGAPRPIRSSWLPVAIIGQAVIVQCGNGEREESTLDPGPRFEIEHKFD